jgi:spermidine/putrescine transport system substrate-binding protein
MTDKEMKANRTNGMSRRAFLRSTAIMGVGALAAPAVFTSGARAEGVLNLLSWPGHGDPAFVKPFEDQYGVSVRAKEYVGG